MPSGRNAATRVLVAFVFAAPAAYAGYHVVLALAPYGVPSDMWRQVFALAAAGAVGLAAMARLSDPESISAIKSHLHPS